MLVNFDEQIMFRRIEESGPIIGNDIYMGISFEVNVVGNGLTKSLSCIIQYV